MSHFRHYKYFAILAGVGILYLQFLADSSFSYFQLILSFVYALAICTIIHAAIWSVFGTGSYFYRLSVSMLFALPVLVGGVWVWVAFIDFDFYLREMALPTFGYFALYASMICVPLSITRSKGFTLVTGKRTADENQPGALSSDEANGT